MPGVFETKDLKSFPLAIKQAIRYHILAHTTSSNRNHKGGKSRMRPHRYPEQMTISYLEGARRKRKRATRNRSEDSLLFLGFSDQVPDHVEVWFGFVEGPPRYGYAGRVTG